MSLPTKILTALLSPLGRAALKHLASTPAAQQVRRAAEEKLQQQVANAAQHINAAQNTHQFTRAVAWLRVMPQFPRRFIDEIKQDLQQGKK